MLIGMLIKQTNQILTLLNNYINTQHSSQNVDWEVKNKIKQNQKCVDLRLIIPMTWHTA